MVRDRTERNRAVLINRRTFIVKRGHLDEAIAMTLAEVKRSGRRARVYAPEVAPFDLMAMEVEFENFTDYEQFWSAWGAQAETEAFWEKWVASTETGGTNEIWRLAE
jgi:hypothetical protein